MNAKMQGLAGIGVAVMLFFSSCQKDLVAPEEEQAVRSDLATTVSADPNDVSETAPPVHTPITTNVNSNVAGYLETLPARYSLTTKKYPMILFIHGIGELGTGVTRVNCCGLPRHINNKTFPAEFVVKGEKFSFIVISPQFKVRPSAAEIQSVISYAVGKYRVDQSRIYIAGLSMGGGSTFDYSAVYGENVAAAVPVCAGTAPTQALAKNIASKNLPLWTISSRADAVVPIQWARDWVAWIKNNNAANAANIKLTEWVNETHNDTWWRAFDPTTKVDGYSVYEWMLNYKRGGVSIPPPANNPPAPAPTPPASGNQAPIAKAGDDQTIPLSWNYFPTINGTASSDPDGWIQSYSWSKVSGPSSFTIVSPNSGQTKVNNLVAGVYTFRLTVTDNKGATATDDVVITMVADDGTAPSGGGITNPVPGNKPPIPRAGDDQTIPLSWNYFPTVNGTTSSDPDGWIQSFSWSKVSGPSSFTIVSPNSGQTKITNLVAGTYVFRLTVTDNSGATATDDVVINMIGDGSGGGIITNPVPGNQPPVARAGADQSIPLSWNYFPTVNGTPSTDPDGWIKAFAWSKVSGPSSYTIVSPNAGQTKINNLVAGTYVFRLTVTDNSGATSTDDVVITMY